ncbi:MAG: hypothetical protein A2283_09510 [Lentisphaerae bacterium RIFOXYA12_FULL_48_11]|nr:MAG: hypothetical protein A2283_09510 [Lentisphaerae bacterium RIFOXYA12_FULL_48_11]
MNIRLCFVSAVSAVVLMFAAVINPVFAKDTDLFLIGLPDNSAAEFGIVKEKYPAYSKKYPEPVVFTVGKSKMSDWPYLHPSSHDAWAGSKAHTFTIKFKAEKVHTQLLYLKIGVVGIWEPSQITITLNEKQIASQRLPKEELSNELVHRPDGEGKSFPLIFPVQGNSVKAGDNTITINMNDGSWILYDYVQLNGQREAPKMVSEEAVDLAKEFLAGPMADVDEIVFAVRSLIGDGHWYANIGYYSVDRERPAYGKGGRLCKLNVKTGKMTIMVDDVEGAVRDPVVHYDGKQILFSYRKGGTDNYLLYLINSDGSGLKQITEGEFDDFEPCWLPDGGIVFVTTRAKRWVNCWLTQVANIWRCDADGKNMRALSANLEQDNTPWMMRDGRIQYMRWEYVDRSQVDYHHLWTMYPDGTAQTVFFGNMHPGGVYIDSKPIPDSDDMVLINSPGHGGIEHEGFLATVSVKKGPDDLSNLRNVSKQRGYRDPWAFNANAFMAANGNKLVLMNALGQSSVLFTLPKEFEKVWLHEPRPIFSHSRELVITSRVDLSKPNGRFLLDNMYHGRNMADVKQGEIKRMMIMESLPKPINFTGGMDPLSYKGTFSLERVLGTVPVEPDGSAYFEAPAVRSLFFVALDGNGKAIKRMQSFTTVQPGETLGCIGCHEHRVTARSTVSGNVSMASKRAPSLIEPLKDLPDLPDFVRDIQPVLDRNCVKCHDYDKRSGGVILTGDHGPMFSHSYYTLTVWKQISDGRNYARSNYEPRKLGSGGSALAEKLEGKHHDVKPSENEKALVRLWLDLGAPYPGTYAALGCGSIGGYIQNNQILNNDKDREETKAAQPVFKDRCISCHDTKAHPVAHTLSDEIGLSFWAPNMDDLRLKYSRHVVFNLSRPEKSLILLAPLAKSAGGYGLCRPKGAASDADSKVFVSKDDTGYKLLLAMCEGGKCYLEEIKRFDMPGFKPRSEYIREMKRYKLLPESFDVEKDPINVYEMDRKYWNSFIYNPAIQTTHN